MFRRQLVFGIYLLLIYSCVRESLGAPVVISKHPRTATDDEGASANRVQDVNGGEKPALISEHLEQHQPAQPAVNVNSDPGFSNAGVRPWAVRDDQEQTNAIGQEIRNFSPISSGERVPASLSTADQLDGRNQPKHKPLSGKFNPGNNAEEEVDEMAAVDRLKEHEKKSMELRTDLQQHINNKVKPIMQKNADKSKRLSFFSVLHPALAAALSPEKPGEKADIPRPPLKTIEYSSGPLRGTETHDHDALRYPAAQSKQSVLAEIQEKAHESEVKEQGERRHDAGGNVGLSESGERYGEGKRDFSLSPRDDFDHSLHHQPENLAKSEGIQVELNRKRSEAIEEKANLRSEPEHEDAGLEVDRLKFPDNLEGTEFSAGHPSSRSLPKQGSMFNVTKAEKLSGTERVLRTTARYWHGFVNRVKRGVDALRSRRHVSGEPRNEQKQDSFTEDDIQDMVNEVVREIQVRTEGRKKPDIDHGLTASEGNRQSIASEKEKGPLLMLRTKTVVSSDVVADAVTSAAKKMLSAKGDTLSHITSSRLLREVQDKLEELLQPID
ncbi:unnamed protein product [Agarophyton chilense]